MVNYGLNEAVKNFISSIALESKTKYDFESNLTERLDINLETTIYRTITELLNNSTIATVAVVYGSFSFFTTWAFGYFAKKNL